MNKPNTTEKAIATGNNGQRALTPQEKRFDDIRTFLRDRSGEIIAAAGDIIDAKWLLNTALLTIKDDDRLRNCTNDSLLRSIVKSARLGLEIGDNGGYLIAYKNQAQFQTGYRGLIDLVVRAGFCSAVKPVIVHERDIFHVHEGTRQEIEHVPDYKSGQRGEPVLVYAVAKLGGGERDFEVLDRPEIERRRKKSKQADSGPWKDDYWRMALKSAIRTITNRMAKSAVVKDRQLAAAVLSHLHDEEAADFEGTVSVEQDPETAHPVSATDQLAEKVRAKREAQVQPEPRDEQAEWEEAQKRRADEESK